MQNFRITAIIIILVSIGVGYFDYHSQAPTAGALYFPFRLGLDLNGGTQLTYSADTSKVTGSVSDAMDSLRQVIERRVNLFGVSEPVVQVEQDSVFSSAGQNKLIVQLPGVTDISTAIQLIGQTPLLEFKIQNAGTTTAYADTGLTGSLISNAQLQFDPTTNEPSVIVNFNSQGQQLFDTITKDNVGKVLGIFLDGQAISLPVIREEIANGQAQISGSFTAVQARDLVQQLNYGALPVPITLIGTQTIGASLGQDAVHKTITAGIVAIILISLFLIIWYRLPGLFATVSLLSYVVAMLALFKLIPVTLTSAGLAGFILSLGIAVDANILIFERIKDELRRGREVRSAISEGFARAWLSIRDGNLSTIISAAVLYFLSNTPLVKGFALTLGIGVVVSLLAALGLTRTFLFAVSPEPSQTKNKDGKVGKTAAFLFGSGFTTSTPLPKAPENK